MTEPVAWHHPNGAIWHVVNAPHDKSYFRSEDGWVPLYEGSAIRKESDMTEEIELDEKALAAARMAADEQWGKWTGGRSGLDGMHFFVQTAIRAYLGAAPPAPAVEQGVVKALEFSRTAGWPKVAETPFGVSYRIWAGKDVWFGDHQIGDRHASSEGEAIEWAQADYEARIRSALAAPAEGSEEAIRIADAVLTWMVKFDLLDADNEYRAEDVLEVLDDLAPAPSGEASK